MLRVSCIFLPMAQKQSCKGRICSKWSPGAAGCGSWSCCLSGRINEEPEWCFVRWLQFGQNLEELAHGGRPGHADILVLELEEVAIPRPRMYPPKFMWIAVISTKVGPRLRSGRAFTE